jgi:hypothetical protein
MIICFTITQATKGGYYVRAQQNPEVVFAGTLDECLAYIKAAFNLPHPAREL